MILGQLERRNAAEKQRFLARNLGNWVFATCTYHLILFVGFMDEEWTNEIRGLDLLSLLHWEKMGSSPLEESWAQVLSPIVKEF